MVLSAKAQRQSAVINLPVNRPPVMKRKRKFKLKGPGVVLLFLMVFALYSFGGQMVESHNVQQEVKNMQQQMADLKKKNDELQNQVKKLESEAWVERAAREKLGLVKPGEKLIMEVKPRDMDKLTAEERESIEIH